MSSRPWPFNLLLKLCNRRGGGGILREYNEFFSLIFSFPILTVKSTVISGAQLFTRMAAIVPLMSSFPGGSCNFYSHCNYVAN